MRHRSAGTASLIRPAGVAHGASALGIAWLIAGAIVLLTGAPAVIILLVIGAVAFAVSLIGGWRELRYLEVHEVVSAEVAETGDDLSWQVRSSGRGRVYAALLLDGHAVARGWLKPGTAHLNGTTTPHETTTLHGTAPPRGVYTSVQVRCSSAGPMGLVWWRRQLAIATGPLSVAPPALSPGAAFDRSSGDSPDLVVTSPAQGRDEVDGVRQWREGDELTAVHWPSTMRSGEYVLRERRRDLDEEWTVTAATGTGDADLEAARVRETVELGLAGGARVAIRVDGGEAVRITDRTDVLRWSAAFDPDAGAERHCPRVAWWQRSVSLPAPEPENALTTHARWAVAAATVPPLIMMLEPLGYGPGPIAIVVAMVAVGAALSRHGQDHRRLTRQAVGLGAALGTAAALIDPSAINSVAASLRFLLPQVLVTLIVLQGFECIDRRSARVALACAATLTAYAAGIRVDGRLTAWLAAGVLFLAVGSRAVALVDRRTGTREQHPPAHRVRAVARRGSAIAGAAAAVLAVLAVLPIPDGPAQLTLPSWLDDYRPTPSDGRLVAADGSPLLGGAAPGGRRSGSGAGGYPGFSPTMDTSLRGDLGDEVVLRVRAPYPDFWRGQTFTRFDGRLWHADEETGYRTEGPDHYVEPAQGDVDNGGDNQFIQTYYAQVDLPNLVFAASRPERVLLSAPMWARPDGALRAEVVLPAGSAYTVISQRSSATAAGLTAEGDLSTQVSPAEFVSVPDTTSDRTRALAMQLAAGSTYETIIAIQAWLAEHVEYDLDAPVPPEGADAVDHFLFESQRGFCEQIATATAIMLRSLGVPARIATGYVPSERDGVAGVWLSRASDAHAWVEVRFPNFGWVAFDPTASVPLAGEAQRATIGAELAKAISAAISEHLTLVLGAALTTAALLVIVRLALGWWRRRRRGRWGVLQDRFVAAALQRGAPTTAPNAELARVFSHPAAAELAATLDAAAFAATWTDDDSSYARAVANISEVQRATRVGSSVG